MTDPRPSDLLIHEKQPLAIIEAPGGGVFNPDGTVNMVLIRPCNGRGPYKNIYEAPMLSGQASNFKGWPMFDNHENPKARIARGGVPRAVSELAGVVRESFWDPAFTTPEDSNRDFAPGAVIGKCKLTRAMEALVEDIPEVIKGSLNCQATNKRLGERNGQRGWVVEGFVNDPETSSFDLVTAAGAGGRVASVMEALYDDSNGPHGHTSNGGSEMTEQEIQAAVAAAVGSTLTGDEFTGQLTTLITEAVNTGVDAKLNNVLESRETAIRESVREELGAANRLRGLAAEARTIIENATIPKVAKDKLLRDYGITENDDDTVKGGRSLNVLEAVTDDQGAVTKSVRDVLRDELNEEIEGYRAFIREAAPTIPRVPGTGAGGTADSAATTSDPAWMTRVRKRGLDPSIFGGPKPPEPATAT